MLKQYRTLLMLVLGLFCVAETAAQNRFEGYNLFVDAPETHKTVTCAMRYVPPSTEITITDLNPATPMRLANCGSDAARVEQRGANAVMRASDANYKWCFTGEDKSYRIAFKGDQYAGQITYNWISDVQTTGTYSVKDFGAVGDGTTDDTIAFKSAVAFIASRNGGTLLVPEGDFIVTAPIALVSGINIRGVSSLQTGAPTNNVRQRSASRIKLNAKSGSIFRIGECVESVSVKDLELFTENNQNTSGIEAVGGFNTSQNFFFERVVFQGFNRGINARMIAGRTGWQFDYIKINHCLFVYNRDTGIYSDVRNSDWKVQSSFFYNPKRTATDKADSMTFRQSAAVLVQDTFGGGFSGAPGGVFLNLLDPTATTIIGSQTESMTASLILNESKVPNAGDYSYPLNITGSVFGHPIIFNSRRTLVSSGNLYGPQTFQADASLRVYSTGDRFCYDGNILGCGGNIDTPNKFDRATVVFMTGQPTEGIVRGHPTFFGTDVQFAAPPQMPSFPQNALPANKPNGSMIYCADCRRSSTPCQTGGTGSPAMVVAGQWSCL